MAIRVFHFVPKTKSAERMIFPFGFPVTIAAQIWDGENPNLSYVQVAKVDTEDKETAFELTNNIDHAWTSNLRVTPEDPKAKYRSTSTGDVMQDEAGELWLCGAVGWKPFASKKGGAA